MGLDVGEDLAGRCAQGVEQGVEVVGGGDGNGLQLGGDALDQPGEHAAGADLDQGGDPQSGQRLHRLAPSDRAAQLGRQQPRPLGRVDVDAGIDVRDHRDLGGEEHRVAEGLAQRRPCRRHQRGVEGPGHRKGHDPSGSVVLGDLAQGGDGVGGAGHHHLARRVEVGHPHVALDALAEATSARCVVGDAQEGGHGPGGVLARSGHGVPASHHQLGAVAVAEGAGRHQCGVLAQGVAGAGAAGERPTRSTASSTIRDWTNVASCALAVWVSSAISASRSRCSTSRPTADDASATTSHEGWSTQGRPMPDRWEPCPGKVNASTTVLPAVWPRSASLSRPRLAAPRPGLCSLRSCAPPPSRSPRRWTPPANRALVADQVAAAAGAGAELVRPALEATMSAFGPLTFDLRTVAEHAGRAVRHGRWPGWPAATA